MSLNTDVLTRLADALLAYGENPISGAKLGMLLAAKFPEINVRAEADMPTGSGALKRFVTLQLAELLDPAGTNGGDVLYQIRGKSSVPPPPDQIDVNFWKTFISPRAPTRLFVDTTETKLFLKSEPPQNREGCMEVMRVTLEEHDRIRSDFTLSLDTQSSLDVAKLTAGGQEFEIWISAIRNGAPQIYRKWGNYRRLRLLELFSTRLLEMKIDDALCKSLVLQMNRSQQKTTSEFGLQRVQLVKPLSNTLVPANGATNSTREFLLQVVKLMSLDDMRSVKVSIGSLMDAEVKLN